MNNEELLRSTEVVRHKWVVSRQTDIKRLENAMLSAFCVFDNVEENSICDQNGNVVLDVYIIDVLTFKFIWEKVVKEYNLNFIKGYWM